MKPKGLSLVVFFLAMLAATGALAQTKTCDALTGTKRNVAMAVLKSQHPYDCCDRTLLECLQRKPVCSLVTRLANDVCRRAAAGQSQADIERELLHRAASLTSPKVKIDLSKSVVAGTPDGRVEIVTYVCARCPYCARLVPQLHDSVTRGRLKGKAKLYVRPFPIRSHEHSTVGGMAWLAAQRLGKSWEMVLHMYKNFQTFDPEKLPDCAAHLGMDRDQFKKLLSDPGLREELVAAKKEGIRNRVDATPTIFLDQRKYQAELSLEAIEDVVEELYERKTAKR